MLLLNALVAIVVARFSEHVTGLIFTVASLAKQHVWKVKKKHLQRSWILFYHVILDQGLRVSIEWVWNAATNIRNPNYNCRIDCANVIDTGARAQNAAHWTHGQNSFVIQRIFDRRIKSSNNVASAFEIDRRDSMRRDSNHFMAFLLLCMSLCFAVVKCCNERNARNEKE